MSLNKRIGLALLGTDIKFVDIKVEFCADGAVLHIRKRDVIGCTSGV